MSQEVTVTFVLALVLGVLGFLPGNSSAQGVPWAPLSLDEALVRAGSSNELVFVDVHAKQCGQCRQMASDVWPTPEAAAIVGGMVAIRIETDSAEGKAFQARYPILGLPTILVLDAKGRELDRLVGYYSSDQWLSQAAVLGQGLDRLARLEKDLAGNPTSLIRTVALLEMYLYRQRVRDAENLLPKIIELDPGNGTRQVERSFVALARYHEHFLKDTVRSEEYWVRFVETYPGASSVGQGVQATYQNARRQDRLEAWGTWMCAVAEDNPGLGKLQYSIASWANRGGLRSDCLAASAQRAHDLGVGSFMDSIAVVLAAK